MVIAAYLFLEGWNRHWKVKRISESICVLEKEASEPPLGGALASFIELQ